MSLDIVGGDLVTPSGVIPRGRLRISSDAIDRVDEGGDGGESSRPAAGEPRQLDATGCWVLPGFVDVHIHGAAGHETDDADPDGLGAMAEFLATRGVTTFLPTTTTASHDDTLAALAAVGEAMLSPGRGARIAGANLEGPYLSQARCGAQDPAHIRPADLAEVDELLDTGLVRIITIASEVDDNLAAIERFAEAGVQVSLGHSDATYEEALAGIAAGGRHATHLFNAMPPLHHRAPGLAGAVLAHEDVIVELITDGVHLHLGTVAAAYRALGPDRACVVTDALRATGLPEGRYPFRDRWVTHRDGAMWLDEGGLSGSALTMDRGFANLVAATGADVAELWPAVSRTPARAARLPRPAELAPGGMPDAVLLDGDLTVRATVIAGEVVHDARAG